MHPALRSPSRPATELMTMAEQFLPPDGDLRKAARPCFKPKNTGKVSS